MKYRPERSRFTRGKGENWIFPLQWAFKPREGIAKALAGIGSGHPPVMGALGENKFDANGDMVRDMLMYVVKDGQAVLYK